MNNSIDQQFVEFVVKSLVSNPDAVQIERRIDEKGVLLELTVDPEDLGRVIGKRGATAQSIRTLLRALGTKNEARYNLKIVDNGVGGSRLDDASTDDHGDAPVSGGTAATIPATKQQNDDFVIDDTNSSASVATENDVVSKTRQELAEFDDLDL